MRFHLDEHVHSAVADGLRRRGIDVTTTVEVGLREAPDLSHIDFAKRERRVIFTQDTDFLILASSGIEHCGVIYTHQQGKSIGQMIEFLVLVDGCMTEDEMRNHVEFC